MRSWFALCTSATLVLGCAACVVDGGSPSASSAARASSAASTSGAPATAATNGIERQRPARVLDAARKALAAAPSLRLTGELSSDGDPVVMDLSLAGPAKGRGTITLGEQQIGLVLIGRTLYLTGGEAFLRDVGGPSAVQLLRGKYLRTTSDDARFTDISALLDAEALAKALLPQGAVRAGTPTTVKGVDALPLTDAEGTTTYVSLVGRPYPLKVEAGSGSGSGAVEFFDYGRRIDVIAPPADTVIDVAELTKG